MRPRLDSRLESLLALNKKLDKANGKNCWDEEPETRRETVAEVGSHGLREDDDGQPRQDGVGHAVHAAGNDGTLFVVIAADFMGPGKAARSISVRSHGALRW